MLKNESLNGKTRPGRAAVHRWRLVAHLIPLLSAALDPSPPATSLDDVGTWTAPTHALRMGLPTPAVPAFIDFGAIWKYLDDGSDQSVLWRQKLDHDSGWASGPAQLGYGDGDESTTVGFGPDPANKFVTTYFRHMFEVANAATYTNLLLRLIRDDGGVVYLNGTEVFRSNMPTGEIGHLTFASTVVSGESEATGFFQKAIDTGLLVAGTNLVAVEIHQATANSTDISFDLALIGNFMPEPPAVVLDSPTNGVWLKATDIFLAASAADSDGTVAKVAFYVNTIAVGEVTMPPYSLTWSNIAPGVYQVTAVAVDNYGLSATSAPAAITVEAPPPTLIPSAATWAYLDDGSDQGAAWRERGFDDGAWPMGRAELGFGEGDEATILNGGPDTNRTLTFYFRHRFSVASIATYSNLVLRLLRDDGAVVYLNGSEVFRSNMPPGPVDYLTVATVATESKVWYATRLNPALLAVGNNLLAVEVHQINKTSSDISFDLELLPNVLPSAPVVRITSPANGATFLGPTNISMSAAATDNDDGVVKVEFYADGRLMAQDSAEPYNGAITNLDVGTHVLLAVARDRSGLARTSGPVSIEIISRPLVTTLIAAGSEWRYLDDGSDQGTLWVVPGFNDSAWMVGTGKFGTNDPPESTVIQLGPSGNRYITTYFRHYFVVTEPACFTNLGFLVLRDDGVVVHLNGVEVFRMNMDDGPIDYLTSSALLVGGTNEQTYFPADLGAICLPSGTNVLAAELHQSGPATGDASFDLELIGISSSAAPNPRPTLNVRRVQGNVVISWQGSGSVLQESAAVGGPYRDVSPPATNGLFTVPATQDGKFFILRLGP